MMTFTIRVRLSDRPGSLALIAHALGQIGANIVELDVLERSVDRAVDQLVVQAPGSIGDEVSAQLNALDGVVVESLRPTRRHAGLPPLGVAVRLGRASVHDVLQTLVDGVVVSFEGTWAAAVTERHPQAHVVAASVGAPSFVGLPTPWLPLRDVRRLQQGAWTPESWLRVGEPLELAAAPLRSSSQALLVCRPYGPRFAQRELADLGMLADLAVARMTEAPVPA
jgi:hypothetical protein